MRKVSYLNIVNPDAVEQISEIIGYKMNNLVTLHGLISSLVFRNMFPIEESPEITVSLVIEILTKQDSDIINKELVLSELNSFKEGLNLFRTIIESTMNKEEILVLSKKAREETKILI